MANRSGALRDESACSAAASTLLGGQPPVPMDVQFIDKAPGATYEFPYHQVRQCSQPTA